MLIFLNIDEKKNTFRPSNWVNFRKIGILGRVSLLGGEQQRNNWGVTNATF